MINIPSEFVEMQYTCVPNTDIFKQDYIIHVWTLGAFNQSMTLWTHPYPIYEHSELW